MSGTKQKKTLGNITTADGRRNDASDLERGVGSTTRVKQFVSQGSRAQAAHNQCNQTKQAAAATPQETAQDKHKTHLGGQEFRAQPQHLAEQVEGGPAELGLVVGRCGTQQAERARACLWADVRMGHCF